LIEKKKNNPSFLRDATLSEETGEIRWRNTDMVVFHGIALRTIFKANRELLGSGADPIWFEAGRKVGLADGELLLPLKEEMPWAQFMQTIGEIFTSMGWGVCKVVLGDPDKKEVIIHVKNCAICRGEISDTAICHYLAGTVEGALQVLLNADVVCRETKCQAKGDPYCEFHVKAKHDTSE